MAIHVIKPLGFTIRHTEWNLATPIFILRKGQIATYSTLIENPYNRFDESVVFKVGGNAPDYNDVMPDQGTAPTYPFPLQISSLSPRKAWVGDEQIYFLLFGSQPSMGEFTFTVNISDPTEA